VRFDRGATTGKCKQPPVAPPVIRDNGQTEDDSPHEYGPADIPIAGGASRDRSDAAAKLVKRARASSGASSSGSAVRGVIPVYARTGALLPCRVRREAQAFHEPPFACGLPADDARNLFAVVCLNVRAHVDAAGSRVTMRQEAAPTGRVACAVCLTRVE
jgi:hypothetical protein